MNLLKTVSQVAVLFLGTVVIALSAWGIARPPQLMQLVSSVLHRQWGIYFGAGVRLVLGAALIIAAPASSFPLAFEVLGWVAILAAMALFAMGRKTTRALIAFFEGLSVPMLRLWLLFGVAFGAFLVYGVV